MFIKSLLLFTLLTTTVLATDTCIVDLERAFNREVISSSPLVTNRNPFNDITDELKDRGFLKEADLSDLAEANREMRNIEEKARDLLKKDNPNFSEQQIEARLRERLDRDPEYLEWRELEKNARVDLLTDLNSRQPSGMVLDFSTNQTYTSSLRRIKSLEGIEPMSAEQLLESGQFPETIYRYDNNFSNAHNSKHLPKARVVKETNGTLTLRPVNPTGDGTVIGHIAQDTDVNNRAASPFISFSENADSVERFGRREASIDVKKLLEGIVSGKVRGVDVITAPQLRNGARSRLTSTLTAAGVPQAKVSRTLSQIKDIAETATDEGGKLTSANSQRLQELVNELAASASNLNSQTRQDLAEKIRLDADYLRHAITNNEVLIRGSVPQEFVKLPKNLNSQ